MTKGSTFAPLYAVCLLAVLGSSASAAQVVALGASNTEGKGRGSTPDGVPRGQAYPAQLASLLSAQGCKVSVLNAGVAGDTTSGMLRRAPGVLAADTKVLILQPGGNDARRGEGGNVAGNVAAIKQLAASRGIQVIMLESLGQVAGMENRTADGQHFNAKGHANMAAWLAPKVRATGACK